MFSLDQFSFFSGENSLQIEYTNREDSTGDTSGRNVAVGNLELQFALTRLKLSLDRII